MPLTRARICTSRDPSVRATASKLTGTSRGAAGTMVTGTAAGAASLAAFFSCCFAPLSVHAASTVARSTTRNFMMDEP